MKSIKKINYVVALIITATILMFTTSCKKETSNDPTLSNEAISSSDASKNILNPFGPSPWQMRSSGTSASRYIIEMSEAGQTTCYAIIYDLLGIDFPPEITITHDGGATWHSKTIAGLENNFLYDIAATTAKTVHVIGYNYVSGGGNVFHSTDGGITWQREAANAYADPASFANVIEFFDPENGVILGDPQNGYFENYTTSDGGNNWKRVPSQNIPPPQGNEYGTAFLTDTYMNTVWTLTLEVDNNFNAVNARLLQSDDKGVTWYVKNSSMPLSSGEGTMKFRNRSVGLFKNNGILYRTTDGGTTWNVVNYSGKWFSFDFDDVPGKAGWWISTGGGTPGNVNSVYGFGFSISYDDGDHWTTLDTLNHTCIDMTNPTHGYSGGVSTDSGNDGVFVYSLPPSGLPSLAVAGNATTDNRKVNIQKPTGNVFLPGNNKFAALRHHR